jgi:hypothetical protein
MKVKKIFHDEWVGSAKKEAISETMVEAKVCD